MQNKYPPEIQAFIKRELAAGNFASENDLVIAALQVYRAAKNQLNRTASGPQDGIELGSQELRDIMSDDE